MKRNLHFLQSALILVLLITGCQSTTLAQYSPETEERIKQVENNLGDWVRTQNDTTWNLVQRMKHHNIMGVSIAVVRDFKLEWVKVSKYIIETALSYDGKSHKVLTPEYSKLRLTPVMQGAAAGVFITRKDSSYYFWHGGANEGFTCYYVGDVISGNGMVIMTNSDNGSLATEVANSVATVYGWKDYYRPVLKTVVDVDETVLDRYVGKYQAGRDIFTIKREGRKLLISPYPGIWINIYFTSDVDFFVRETQGDMKYMFDADGKVTGFSAGGMLVAKVE